MIVIVTGEALGALLQVVIIDLALAFRHRGVTAYRN